MAAWGPTRGPGRGTGLGPGLGSQPTRLGAAQSARAVVLDVHDPDLSQEAQLVALATGRRIVRAEDVRGGVWPHPVIVVTDHGDGAWEQCAARIIRVDHCEPPLADGGAPRLAEEIGMSDIPRIAVMGACGGAGTSTLALALAAACSQDLGEAVVVDADPLSAGMDVLSGVEGESGWRLSDCQSWRDGAGDVPGTAWVAAGGSAPAGTGAGAPADADATSALGSNAPWIEGPDYRVAVISNDANAAGRPRGAGDSEAPRAHRPPEVLLRQRLATVVDAGRFNPSCGAQRGWLASGGWDGVVIVSTMTVMGVTAARQVRQRCLEALHTEGRAAACTAAESSAVGSSAAGRSAVGEPLIVLRRVPGSELTLPMAAVLLSAEPEVLMEYDPELQTALDSGAVDPGVGPVAQAAREVLDQLGWGSSR